MTPFRDNGRGSFVIDRRTRIGRIKLASGTNHPATFKRLNEMITVLQETARYDLLRAIQEHRLAPLSVYEAFRANELHRLPTADEMRPLAETIRKWMSNAECGEKQRTAHKTAVNHLLALATADATVTALPTVMKTLRATLKAAGKHAQFNRCRSSAQAFLRDTLSRQHRLYVELAQVPKLKEVKQRRNNPQTYAELLALSSKLSPEHQTAMWTMALTGMGPAEYFGQWELLPDRIHIPGTKREARERVVPLVLSEHFSRPEAILTVGADWAQRRFGNAISRASAGAVKPYDLRRTYVVWLEAAGITRTRRKLYLGHAVGDVTGLYEWHEVRDHLVADAAKLTAYLNREAELAQLHLVRDAL